MMPSWYSIAFNIIAYLRGCGWVRWVGGDVVSCGGSCGGGCEGGGGGGGVGGGGGGDLCVCVCVCVCGGGGDLWHAPHKGLLIRTFGFIIVSMNNLLSKRSGFETPWRSCEVTVMLGLHLRNGRWNLQTKDFFGVGGWGVLLKISHPT